MNRVKISAPFAFILAATLSAAFPVLAKTELANQETEESQKPICDKEITKDPLAVEIPTFHYRDVLQFSERNAVLSHEDLLRISTEVHAFQLGREDMGGAFLLRVLEKIGPRPSRHLDLMYGEYLKPFFKRYELQFLTFLKSPQAQREVSFPALYGLESILSPHVRNGMIEWNLAASSRFAEALRLTLTPKGGLKLDELNHVLVQMVYLYSNLSENTRMSPAEIRAAADGYARALSSGQIFIPTAGEWDIPNVVAQWFSNVTVNMLPKDLAGVTDVHGGVQSLEGVSHDHGHVYTSRIDAFAQIMGEETGEKPSAQRIHRAEKALERLLARTLLSMREEGLSSAESTRLINSVFFFIHEPKAFVPVLMKIKSGERNWAPDSSNVRVLALTLKQVLIDEQNFYPNLGKDFGAFERTFGVFLSRLGTYSAFSELPSLLGTP